MSTLAPRSLSSLRLARTVPLVLALAISSAARAQTAPPAAPPAGAAPAEGSDEAALRRYAEGRRLLEASDYAGALVELTASFGALPSPNTELLIGHAQRLGGDRVRAASTYLHVIASAGEKVRQGEERFQATLEEAGRWAATLRASLIEVDVFVVGASAGTKITVDGAEVPAVPGPRGMSARLAHEPGTVKVEATAPDGRTVSGSGEAAAGGTVDIDLDLAQPEATPPPPPTSSAKKGGLAMPPPVPVWIAGGVGVAGLAMFGIFGAMSSGAASDLVACAPSCPESLRDTADSGSRDQTIANVGLVVGATGLVAAGVLWIVLPGDEDSGSTPKSAVRLRVSPAGAADATVRF